MGIIDTITITGGMNSDADELSIKGIRKRLNCRVGTSDKDNLGAVENLKGNTLVSFVLPTGTNKCIGYAEDIETGSIFYFVYNSNNHHLILQYELSSNSIITVLKQDFDYFTDLNFNPKKKIRGANVVQGLLYWTDNFNPPRKINIDKAKRYTATGGSDILGYKAITTQVIDRIKHPPLKSPVINYSSDQSTVYNNLRGALWQFCYRYVYDDNEKSVTSPISKVSFPINEEKANGDWVDETYINNCLDVIINTGGETVSRIEIFARGNSESSPPNPVTVSCNNSEWFLVDTLEKYDQNLNQLILSGINYVYKFYNNKVRTSADQSDLVRLFDYVPQKVGAQDLIGKNRILDADVTEGYDNVDIDVELNHKFISYLDSSELILSNNSTDYIILPTDTNGDGSYDEFEYRTYISFPTGTTLQSGQILKITVTDPVYVDPLFTTNTIQGEVTVSHIALTSNWNTELTALAITLGIALNPPHTIGTLPVYYLGADKIYIFSGLDYSGSLIPSMNIVLNLYDVLVYKTKHFKTGAYHDFGLVYYDRAIRSGAVNVSNKTTKYVPYYTEFGNLDNGTGLQILTNSYFVNFDWKIKHQPPEWATNYQWVYSKNISINSYLNFSINASDYDVATNKIRIGINPNIIAMQSMFTKSIVSAYVWTKGDRIRFLANFAYSGNYSLIKDLSTGIITYLDFEIVGYDTANDLLLIENFTNETSASPPYNFYTKYGINATTAQGTLVEIYSPAKKVTEKVFYEIGECFEIGNPHQSNRYHKGQLQDQNPLNYSGIPATGQLFGGDSYVLQRFEPNAYYYVESEHASDFYISDSYDIGRVNIIDKDMRQVRNISKVYYGGQLIQDTRVNELSKVEFNNYVVLADKFGAICKLIESGNVVKIIQEKKVSSLYVGLQSTGEADGSAALYVTNRVLGTIRVPEESYGTKYPESCFVDGRHLFFLDTNKSCFVQDSANGMLNISQLYGYQKETKEICKNIKAYLNEVEICSVYDQVTKQYIFTYSIYKPSIYGKGSGGTDVLLEKEVNISKTTAFMDSANRWNSEYSFVPEMYGVNGDMIVMFLNGELWTGHTNEQHCWFFGKKYPQQITFVFNNAPAVIKLLLSMAYASNKKWSVPLITIHSSDQNPIGMKSRLHESKFILKEGIYYSEFLNDMLTPMATSELEGLINGRPLRGQSAEITIENLHDELTVIRYVIVNFITSERSGK